jgi:hypothetical protein
MTSTPVLEKHSKSSSHSVDILQTLKTYINLSIVLFSSGFRKHEEEKNCYVSAKGRDLSAQ